MKTLYNGRVITPSRIINDGYVVLSKDKIVEVGQGYVEIPNSIAIDCQGAYIAPGFIDLHCHGGGGHDFLEATPEAFESIAQAHARYGMTSVYATTACCPVDTIYQVLDVSARMQTKPHKGCHILGVHLEGNYLNEKYKGGQNPLYLSLPCKDEYQSIAQYNSQLKRWSISPELPGALPLGQWLERRGILASLAHTEANHSTLQQAVDSGYKHVTHLYNAMTTIHKQREFKHAGVVESVYLLDQLTVEIIADGVHNPVELLRLAHKFKGVERTALITDAMACAGIEGITTFDNGRVVIEDGVGKLADRSALAGSIATADKLISVMTHRAGVPLLDAVRMASETPANIMGIGHCKGRLQKGYDADVVVFDRNIGMHHVFIGGIEFDL